MISTLPINRDTNIGGEPTLFLDDFLLMPGLSNDLPGEHRLLLDTGRSAIYLALVNILQRSEKRSLAARLLLYGASIICAIDPDPLGICVILKNLVVRHLFFTFSIK
ncbi:MAG: hypothetical protein ABRQ26_07380 [Syntrophomonadaceae bacterium]